jgi:hypothetical protein
LLRPAWTGFLFLFLRGKTGAAGWLRETNNRFSIVRFARSAAPFTALQAVVDV